MNKRTPILRFPGFTDDWEQRKLLDCIQKITDFRGRTPKKLGMDWSEKGYLALSALNVKDGYIDFNQDVHYGNQELYDKWMSGNELHKGQVLFTTEAPMGNVAQVPDNQRYILSQRTIAFDVKDNLITESFLATVLRTPTVFTDLTALSSGGTAKGVSQKSLASVEIRLPKDLKEQEKISDTFLNIDNLITLHRRKCDKLKSLKKSMLQKMFPKEGATVPEIRFPGFTDAWEQRKLDDILIERHILSKISDEYPRLSFTIEEGVIDPEDRKTNKRDFLMKDEANKKFLLTEVGDIIYNPANVVFGAIHRNSYGKGCLSPIYRIFETNQESRFLECVVRSETFISKLAQKTEGSVVKLKTLKPEAFLEMTVSVSSSLDEQTKIADFFDNLDNLITLHQRKLDEIKEYKAGLLHDMFV